MSKESEDLREWLINNFDAVEDSIKNECEKWSEEHGIKECKTIKSNELDIIDVDNLCDNIAAALKVGLLNVISTYQDDGVD